MLIKQADPEFRPVTIVIETEDEFDKLIAIIASVAENRINHQPPVMRAAIEFRNLLLSFSED